MYLQWILLFLFFDQATSDCTEYIPGGKRSDYPINSVTAVYDAGRLAALFKSSKQGLTLPTLPSSVEKVSTKAESSVTSTVKEAFPFAPDLAASVAMFISEPDLNADNLLDKFSDHVEKNMEEAKNMLINMKGYADEGEIKIIKHSIDVEIFHMFDMFGWCLDEKTAEYVIDCLKDGNRYIRGGQKFFMIFLSEVMTGQTDTPPTDGEMKQMELTLLPFRLYAFLDMFTLQTLINALKEDAFRGHGQAREDYIMYIKQQIGDAKLFQKYAKDVTNWILSGKEGNEKECAEKYWKGHFDVFDTVLSPASAQYAESFDEEYEKKDASNQWVDLDVEIIL